MTEKNARSAYAGYAEVSEDPVDLCTFLALADGYNKFLSGKVLEGHEAVLPERMGTLSIEGRVQRVSGRAADGRLLGIPPDWPGTKALWERDPVARAERRLLYHLNLHSDGIRYKFLWSKRRVLVEYKTLYAFRATRANKRAASARIRAGERYRAR